MKKIIALVITFLLLFSCFCMATQASEMPYYEETTSPLNPNVNVSFSADYKTLFFGAQKYVSFPCENMVNDPSYTMPNEINLTETQSSETTDISIYSCEYGTLISAEISFTDGSCFTTTYIKENYIEELNDISNSPNTAYTVDFIFPTNNTIITTYDKLLGELTTIKNPYDIIDDYFYVEISTKDKKLKIFVGYLILYNDEYYYYDFAANNTSYSEIDLYDIKSINAYKISDADTIKSFESAKKLYYDDEFGFFLDDNFSKKVAIGFIIFLFAIIPFAALIFFIILTVKSKGIYKKLSILTSAFLVAELIIFIIITLLTR